MESNNLSKKLKSEAVALGLCDEWQGAWQDNTSQQELINKYLRGIDFCLQHKWPTAKFIKEHFDLKLLRKNMILADDKYSLNMNNSWHDGCVRPYAMVLGNSESTIRVSCNSPVIIYLNDGCNVRLIVHTGELVRVEVRDRAQVDITSEKHYMPRIEVSDYSDDSIVIAPEYIGYKQEEEDYLFGNGG